MSGSDSDDVTAAASRSRELLEDIDEAADELIDSVQYLQETMEAGEGVYESKWLGGVMRAHEMLLSVRGQLEHASAWPCDGEGDEHGNFVCRHISRNKPVALRIAIDDGWNYFDWQPGKAEKLRAKGQIVQELYDAPSPAAASRSREDGPSDEAIAQAIKATEYKYFGDYPMSDGQIDAVGVLVAAARALTRSRLNHAAAAEAPSSAERVTNQSVEEMVGRLEAIDEASMYEHPATTKATVKEAASLLTALAAENERLSAERVTPSEVEELVARLEKQFEAAKFTNNDRSVLYRDIKQAASSLQSLSARVRELETALADERADTTALLDILNNEGIAFVGTHWEKYPDADAGTWPAPCINVSNYGADAEEIPKSEWRNVAALIKEFGDEGAEAWACWRRGIDKPPKGNFTDKGEAALEVLRARTALHGSEGE